MTPIPISSCDRCRPDLWEDIGRASITYKCIKCETTLNRVLARRQKNEHPINTTKTSVSA